MAYIDGFILAVPHANKQTYIDMESKFGPLFKHFGATSFVVAWGDDVPQGVLTSFPRAVHLEEGENVVLSWITWPDKATRDAGNAAVMVDPIMAEFDPETSPFDGKRMIFGGFEVVLEL